MNTSTTTRLTLTAFGRLKLGYFHTLYLRDSQEPNLSRICSMLFGQLWEDLKNKSFEFFFGAVAGHIKVYYLKYMSSQTLGSSGWSNWFHQVYWFGQLYWFEGQNVPTIKITTCHTPKQVKQNATNNLAPFFNLPFNALSNGVVRFAHCVAP